MYLFNNPAWLNQFQYPYSKFEEIPQSVFDEINSNLGKIISPQPEVTILISAWNEEVNILRCIASLSKTITRRTLEIIVVNNNSQDNTQATLDKLHIRSMFEVKQGCGPARQTGQEQALGKYVLLADADCFYPSCWVDEMISVLEKPKVVCVYGRYSFISEPGFPRWQLKVMEVMKDVIAEFRHLNQPYLNTYGISMGYVREYGLKVGFIKTRFWGDDGQLALGLLDYGTIKQVRSNKARVWTGPRSLQRDGTLISALKVRLKKELKRFFSNFKSHSPERMDTN
jgi:glycosyltransferase involved in cell wall biosynthesis